PTALFFSHGSTECIPAVPNSLIAKAQSIRKACSQHAPFDLTAPSPRIGVLTAHFGSETHYQAALQTYLLHGLVHGHQVHVLCDPIVDAIWNKPAFILKVMMEEMLRPEHSRMAWTMWADRDTLILDQCRPVSTFLPPSSGPALSPSPSPFTPHPPHGLLAQISSLLHLPSLSLSLKKAGKKDIHLLISNDKNGLNAGIFLLRTSQLSLSLLTSILSHPSYHPTTRLRFSEQTAMALLIRTPAFRPYTQLVPQFWFNSYTGAQVFAERMDVEGLEGGFREGYVRRGDFVVHFAGNVNKGEDVRRWMEMLEREGIVWVGRGGVQRDVGKEVEGFWRALG
ncbi:hypothetical protein CC80DRAFT_388414, partial [Byssothecium circinans]